MPDRTENTRHNPDTTRRDLPAVDVPADLVDQPLLATRPAWMPVEEWDRICLQLTDKLDELVEIREADQRLYRDGCHERPWCIVRNLDEHNQFHCGNVVGLAGTVDLTRHDDPGWHAYLTQDRGERAKVVLQGHEERFEAAIPAAHIVMVLAATDTEQAREAMWDLITADGVDG